MKFDNEYMLLIILITFFMVLIIWNFIYPNRKESFENIENSNLDVQEQFENIENSNLDIQEQFENSIDSDTEFHKITLSTSHQLGNYVNCYFYNLGTSFLNGKNFQTEIIKNADMFTNYFPEKVMFDKSIQDAFISFGITKKILEDELNAVDGHCASSWQTVTKEREVFWTIMKPTVNRILKDALEKSNLNKVIDGPVIHYRCSDMPFGKLEYYHFQKYSYFKNGLDLIQEKTGKKYNKVYICYCNSHNSEKENQESCDKYIKSLTLYLENLGYDVISKCQSVNEDFATMFYAPGLISTSSSFSFMSGYFSDGVFINTFYDERRNKDCKDCGDWLQRGYTLKHSEVVNYHDTEKVISMLK